MAVAQQANFQFLHTLGSDVYVYVFGDRIGQLSLSGVAFASGCGNAVTPVSGQPFAGDHGLVGMNDWYKDNRISRRRERGFPIPRFR